MCELFQLGFLIFVYMLKRFFPFIIIGLSANFLSGQVIEPTLDFYTPKTYRRISEQTSKNSVFISGSDILSNTSISSEYEQKIEKPENNHQKITINNIKFNGYTEVGDKKQLIKEVPENMKIFSIYTNKNGIIDSINAPSDVILQLKQTVTSRIDKGMPNPHFFHVKTTKKIGDSWVDSSFNNDENNNYFVQYKFEKQEENLNVLSFNGEIKMLLNYEQNQVPFQSNVVGNLSGTIYVEPKTNYIIHTEGKMKLEGRIIVNTQEFPTVIAGTFNDKLKK